MRALTLELEHIPAIGVVDAPGLEAHGAYVAAALIDGHAAQVAPVGAKIIIDTSNRTLTEADIFAILIDGDTQLRRYRANPPRFESLAFPPAEVFFHTTFVDVLGRLRAVLTVY